MDGDSKKESALLVLETIPLVMRSARAEMRKRHSAEMSAMQLRALSYVQRNEGASLTNFAEHAGISLSSASKIIDGLVEKKMMRREADRSDRRRIILSLTAAGEKKRKQLQNDAMEYFAGMLAPLTEKECETVLKAMALLGGAFSPAGRNIRQGEKK